MRISVVQMNPGADKAENIAQARRLIGEAVEADRPDIVSLPEVWDSLGGDRTVRNANAELLPAKGSNEPGGAAYEFLRETARAAKVHVHGGSIIEQGPEKLFNTTVVFDPDGQEIARYRKMHLFDIVAPDGTGYRESNTYGAGDEVVTYQAGGIKVGCAICYDMRFPDLFWKLREQGAEVIFLPSAFTLATGKDHWEVMIRARAIETQCWFAAPATWGKHLEGKGEPRFTYGHSMIVDPWGHITAQGVRRHRLGHRADRSQGHRAGAPRHAGAGTPEARLNDLESVPLVVRSRDFVPGRIAFAGSATALATEARERLVARYGDCPLEQAAVVVALGGDGSMLETIHRVLPLHIPVYGMNCGSVGFLMNTFSEDDLPARLARAQEAVLYPLRMHAVTADGAEARGAGVQRGHAAAPAAPDREDPHHRRRAGAAGGTDLRRRADLHAGGLDRLQPVGARPDRAAVGQPAAADADLGVPPAALARRAAAEHRGGAVRGAGGRQAADRGGGRLHRGARRGLGGGERGPLGQRHGAVRSRPRPVGADHRRAVHGLKPTNAQTE